MRIPICISVNFNHALLCLNCYVMLGKWKESYELLWPEFKIVLSKQTSALCFTGQNVLPSETLPVGCLTWTWPQRLSQTYRANLIFVSFLLKKFENRTKLQTQQQVNFSLFYSKYLAVDKIFLNRITNKGLFEWAWMFSELETRNS